jgi:8-oxo-dGTP pyrophosphatase MutT (NUDIX family)
MNEEVKMRLIANAPADTQEHLPANFLKGFLVWLRRKFTGRLGVVEVKQFLQQARRQAIANYIGARRSKGTSKSRAQHGAFALITIGQDQDRQYLLQWNANWGMFNLIGGKIDNSKGDENSFTRTIQRELEEELGLQGPEECSIVRELQQVQMRQYSHREHVVKDYYFCIFEVDLFPKLPVNRESLNHSVRWLSTGRENIFVSDNEIERLCTVSGRPISPTTRSILREMGESATASRVFSNPL